MQAREFAWKFEPPMLFSTCMHLKRRSIYDTFNQHCVSALQGQDKYSRVAGGLHFTGTSF